MKSRIALAGILLLGFALQACDRSTEPVVLAHFDVAQAHEDTIFGQGWIQPRGVHRFGEGWRHPEPKGIWTTRREATLDFSTMGRSASLTLCVKANPLLVKRGQTYTVFWNGRELGTRRPPGGWQPDTLRVDIPDDAYLGGSGTLRLVASDLLGPEDGFESHLGLFVQSFELVAQLRPQERKRWNEITGDRVEPSPFAQREIPPRSSPDARPDLLVILLDAAGAGHFSCYGYDRPTTPNVDALAKNGVRFQQAFAAAPYTRNSVASIFSGKSWRDHQVLTKEDALSQDNYTLAECLRDAGYLTLGYSDNVNVGFHAGSTQGFDEFHEVWKEYQVERAAQPRPWFPEAPVKGLEERIARGIAPDVPVFAYLHLLPPHEPYFPGKRHDLFGDPDYDGEIRGIHPDIVSFDRGIRPAKGPDYERLVSLYDGALHRADALAQRAIDAWKSQSRDRPLLVVILSDHGDGFGEHERFGHNSTPYDEMVRVPLIFSPRDLVPEKVAEARRSFLSLEDLYPLLIRTLGVGFPTGITMPNEFFAAYDSPNSARNDVYIRCAIPIVARRTPTSLAIFREWNEQSLFDLREDPAAQKNLRGLHPDRWLEEWQHIRRFVSARADSSGSERSRMTPEEIDRLKALGYN